MDWQTLLVTVFVYIGEQYKTRLWPFCQRMSNNHDPKFSDEELLTIFLYGVMKKRFELKDIYNYASSHLREWFPHLPSYVAFVQRLNRFDSLFPMLIELILNDFSGSDLIQQIRLIDSMPIILANAKRSAKAKVANQLANKGYCASKGIYYYGVKVHILGLKRQGTLPLPEYIGLTSASEHDLIVFGLISHLVREGEVYADKAYIDEMVIRMRKPFKLMLVLALTYAFVSCSFFAGFAFADKSQNRNSLAEKALLVTEAAQDPDFPYSMSLLSPLEWMTKRMEEMRSKRQEAVNK
ncbi:MAG: transposase [bacterium]